MVILLTALQPAVVRRQRGQQRALGMWLGQQLAVPSVRRRSQTAMISVCSSQDIVMSSTSIAFDTNLPVSKFFSSGWVEKGRAFLNIHDDDKSPNLSTSINLISEESWREDPPECREERGYARSSA